MEGNIGESTRGAPRHRMLPNENQDSVWWPGVTKQMTEMIQQCSVCAKEATPRKEPLLTTPLLDYPWQVIGTDLFELKGVTIPAGSRLLLKVSQDC